MTNEHNTVLYTGVTGGLKKRVYQHKEKLVEGFTKRYNINKLVYYEPHEAAVSAITREKQIKAGPRGKKIELIKNVNPEFEDLYDKI
jgi:putative endonuclease